MDTSLEALFLRERPSVVYHLAAQVDVRQSMACPVQDTEVNVVGTVNILELAGQVGSRVVFASSGGAVYAPGSIPARVGDPCLPISPYGAAKLAAETYVTLYAQMRDVPHMSLRLANVYGPRQDTRGEGGVIALYAGAEQRHEQLIIYGDGLQTRDFVFVGDVARAFVLAGSSTEPGIINIGTGIETPIKDLADLFPVPRIEHHAARAGEVLRSALDPSLAAARLHWMPMVDLAHGVKQVQHWAAVGEPVLPPLGPEEKHTGLAGGYLTACALRASVGPRSCRAPRGSSRAAARPCSRQRRRAVHPPPGWIGPPRGQAV